MQVLSLIIYGINATVVDVTYIYALVDPDTMQVRYVGKANDPAKRYARHIMDDEDSHKVRWLRQLSRNFQRPLLKILQVVPAEIWADAERHWIKQFDNLVNSSEGGKGIHNPSAETREKMRQAKIGTKLSSETKRKLSEAKSGKPKPVRSPEHIANLSQALKGRVISKEQRVKLAKANMYRVATGKSGMKGVWFDSKRNTYQALIRVNKKTIHLGRYRTLEDAALAYNNAAIKIGYPAEGLNIL